MTTFRWQVRHFPTVAAFAAYLATLRRPDWAEGLTLHHTVSPTLAEWRGRASMDAIGRYYRDTNKWDSGPQVFIGPDGIWQGTPVNEIGVHAGPCNDRRIGIEVVGFYDRAGWAEPITSLVYGALDALLDWLLIAGPATPATLNGHRDCGSPKTCPGRAIDLAAVRAELNRRRRSAVLDLPVIGVLPSITLKQWQGFCARNGAPLSGGEIDYLYGHALQLEIDPAFFGAVWVHEGGRPLGSSELQRQTRSPINLRAAPGEWRPTVTYRGAPWHAYESFFLGALAGLLHLKQVYGWQRQLHSVAAIIPVFAPASDGNDVTTYIRSVLDDMQYMRTH